MGVEVSVWVVGGGCGGECMGGGWWVVGVEVSVWVVGGGWWVWR